MPLCDDASTLRRFLAACAFLTILLLPALASATEICTAQQRTQTMRHHCTETEHGVERYVDFCETWVRCHFGNQAPEIVRILEGVDSKKDVAKAAAQANQSAHFRAAVIIAILSFFSTVFVAISKTSYSFADWFSIPAIVAAALVTLATSIVAIYAFDKAVIRNETIRADFGELQSDIQLHLLRAARENPDLTKPAVVPNETLDSWIKRNKDLGGKWVGDYIASFSKSPK